MIEFRNITKIYDKEKVLKGVDLDIEHGEFISIIGATGSGKTTLINLLIGALKPEEGKILIDEVDITSLISDDIQLYRRNIGVIFQDFKLINNRTVYENISLALEVCEYSDEDIPAKIQEIAEFVDMSDKLEMYPRQLSGGEKQKVAIARAMVHDPKLLIADEPTGNLDPDSTKDILTLLLKINNKGYTVIITTHNVDLVDFIQKRVVKLDKGIVVSDKQGGYH